jgi:mono/diheme cytochrome c family protein
MRVLVALLYAVPVVAAQSSADGKALFEKKCSICHAGETEERRIGPSLKGVKDGRLPDAIGKKATRENILKQINDGGNGMPVFRELLTKDEKDAIVAYVMTL